MTKGVQFRRGDSTSHNSFTGRQGELTVNTDKKIVVVHDNAKQGGYELVGVAVTQELSNKTFSGVTTFTNSVVSGVSTIGLGSISNALVSGALTATTLNATTGIVTDLRITGITTIEVNSSTNALRINQLGSGNAIIVEDSTSPDLTPFVVTGVGSVGIGTSLPPYILSVVGSGATANTPGFAGAVGDLTGNSNTYTQLNLRNTSNATTASADFIVTADTGTDTEKFVDLGINNSGFTTSDAWNINGALDAYLYASSHNLSIGAGTGDKRLALFAGGFDSPAEKLSVTKDGVGIGVTAPAAFLAIRAGSGTTVPLKFHNLDNTLVSTAQTGAIEFASEGFYGTPSTTLGRGHIAAEGYFRLNANRGTITGATGTASTNFFGNIIPMAAGKTYEIDAHLYLSKAAAGITTFQILTHQGTPTNLTYFVTYSPITGVSAAAAQAPLYFGGVGIAASSTNQVTGSLSVASHQFAYKIIVENNTAQGLGLHIISTNGNFTPLRGSYWRIRQLPSAVGVGATLAVSI